MSRVPDPQYVEVLCDYCLQTMEVPFRTSMVETEFYCSTQCEEEAKALAAEHGDLGVESDLRP